MFCRCFGNYLADKNIITGEQLSEILNYRKNNRVKLGLIAVENKMLTVEQAEEINRLQMKEDKRFGDIAVEKGWLSDAGLKKLLGLQQNPYLIFVQAATEQKILSKETVEVCVSAYQREQGFSDMDMEAFKNGDMDTVVALLLHMEAEPSELISLALKNVIRFVSTDLAVGKVRMASNAEYAHIAAQQLKGDYNAILGFGCQNDELLKIAVPYGKEEFTELNADAMDAVCEFINCTNGLYASKASQDHVEIDMQPPVCAKKVSVSSEGSLLIIPVQITGTWMEIFVAMKTDCQITQ